MEILFSQQEIAKRVAELGKEITEFYRGKQLLVVAIANGGIIFAADLVRQIPLQDLELDTVAVSSYVGDKSTGKLVFRAIGKQDPSGKHVLVIDDILDGGVTLLRLQNYFLEKGALSCRSAVAFEKDIPRSTEGVAHAAWCGFIAPDRYLVGYGMDSCEHFRNLPYVAAID